MAKKDQRMALDNMLGTAPATAPEKIDGRKRSRHDMHPSKTKAGYESACVMVNSDLYAKIKEIALIEKITIKAVLEMAMKSAVTRYEQANGEIKIRRARTRDLSDLLSR